MRKVTKKDCVGCRDDFYNQNDMGLNMRTGKPQCWSLVGASLRKAMDVPWDLRPPYKMALTERPNCYRAAGHTRVLPEELTPEGFWKT